MDFMETIQKGLEKVLSSKKDISVQLLECLQEVTTKQIQKGLGDRNTYVGASDLNGCVRKAILGKRNKRGFGLQSALHLVRGHLAELIIMMALRAQGVKFLYQPELVHPIKPYNKAHVDFMFVGKDRVHILEIKSGKKKKNFADYEAQITNQMGIAQAMYPNRKVTESLCHMDLTAATINYNNEYEYDKEEDAKIQAQVDLFWDVMQHPGTEDAHCKQTPLCGWCDFIGTCPKYSGEDLPAIEDNELEEQVLSYLDLDMSKSQINSDHKEMNEKLKEIFVALGRTVKVGEYSVGTPKRSRRGDIDEKKLKNEKPDVWADLDQNYRKPASVYHVLNIKPLVNKTKKKAA